MSSIEVLQAKHGDSFIVYCQKGNNKGIVVIDGGPTTERVKIKRTLDKIEKIDLMILTHYDDDHIGGLVSYIKGHIDDKCFPVKELWVNCARHIDFNVMTNISFIQANSLATYLSKIDNANRLIWKEYIHDGYVANLPFTDIIVLSPTEEVQNTNREKYEACIKETETFNCSGVSNKNKDLDIDLDELSNRKKNSPNINNQSELANMASISFILECDGLKLLMLGDSYPQTVVTYLKKIGYNITNKLKVDYVKISHHGSRHNTSNELLDLIDCDKYIISTNGGRGNSYHPNRETFANILCHPERDKKRTVHLYFNYELLTIEERCGRFFNDGEEKLYNFVNIPINSRLKSYE